MVESAGKVSAVGPLLETKLYVPKWRPGLVPRPGLIERLNDGFDRKLTLVSAPAGFGKTTLLAEWLASSNRSDRPVAWLSLDQSDGDPALFWTYFTTALQKILPGVGESALSFLRSPQLPPIESVLTSLINEINAVGDNLSTGSGASGHGFVLVLDDYHVIDAKPIHSGITFLLDHMPAQMHLVIASRSDPPLPLVRLRARDQSVELRAADLCFTPNEAAVFLNEVMGLDLSAADVTALEMRTEGWIAGLQLAALSMRGRTDTAEFIRAFAGDDRYIVDYLVEEVLQRQPDRVRNFLLRTSVLDRLSGHLCDAVTGEENGCGMLDSLERRNLFVVPLDDKRQWYRYHHLFAEVLQARMKTEQPDQVPVLHQRASEWYEWNGSHADAISHAIAAKDLERAAGLIELAWPAISKGFQPTAWLGWVKALPDELVSVRPVLSAGYAWMLLDGGELEAAGARLLDAERWLDTTADSGELSESVSADMVVVNEEEFQSLPATIATARAYLSQAHGDIPATVKYAQLALKLLPETDHYWRGIAATFLGFANWGRGDLESALRSSADAVASFQMADNVHFQVVGTVMLADIKLAQGRLSEAASTYEQSLRIATDHGGPLLKGTVDLYAGLSEIHREWGDLEAATQYLVKGKEQGRQTVLPGGEYRLSVAMARVKLSKGDLDGALDQLSEAERLYKRDPVPDLRPVAASKTRVWLAQNRLSEALDWARERKLSVDDALSYVREFEHITLVKVLVASYRSAPEQRKIFEAEELLERLLSAAESGQRNGSVIEILAMQALARDAQGNIPGALESLERAIALAEPEGYVRIFVDEGKSMRDLLRHAAAAGISGSYIRRLITAFSSSRQPVSGASGRTGVPGLAEPLTERETEILRLISAGLSNHDIAAQLVISIATVKRHNTNIYGKLGVTQRTQASARANELNLL